jgi:gas vesicle protein
MGEATDLRYGDDIPALKENIRRTRAEMSATIDELQERLSPEVLKAQLKDTVRERVEDAKHSVREATIGRAENMARKAGETVTDVRHGVIDTIRDNPIPAAMVGIGLGWLLMNGRSSERTRTIAYDDTRARGGYWPQVSGQYGTAEYYGTEAGRPSYTGGQSGAYRSEGTYMRTETGGQMYGEGQRSESHESAIHRVTEKVGDVGGEIREKVSDVAGRVQHSAGQLADQAQYTVGTLSDQAQHAAASLAEEARRRALRIETRVGRTFDDNPIGLGAAAVAMGLAIGMALPRTRREDELLGPTRDQLLERAEDVMDEGKSRLRDVAETALDKVEEKVDRVADTGRGYGSSSGFGSGTSGGTSSGGFGSGTVG